MTEKKALITMESEGSDILALADGGVDLAEIIRENAGPAGLTPSLLDRIKVPGAGGTTWSVPSIDGEKEEKEVQGVIIAFSDKRKFWRTSFEDSAGTEPPDCFSPDTLHGIGDPGGDCVKCEFAQWGSKGKGSAQACRKVRLLALLCTDSVIPRIVSVPPSSYKHSVKFHFDLSGAKYRYYDVVVGISLAKDKSGSGITYSRMVFRKVRELSPEEKVKVAAMRASLGDLLDQDRVVVQEPDEA